MESDHEDVQEHDCYVEMNVVQSWTAPDREPEDSSKGTSEKASERTQLET